MRAGVDVGGTQLGSARPSNIANGDHFSTRKFRIWVFEKADEWVVLDAWINFEHLFGDALSDDVPGNPFEHLLEQICLFF